MEGYPIGPEQFAAVWQRVTEGREEAPLRSGDWDGLLTLCLEDSWQRESGYRRCPELAALAVSCRQESGSLAALIYLRTGASPQPIRSGRLPGWINLELACRQLYRREQEARLRCLKGAELCPEEEVTCLLRRLAEGSQRRRERLCRWLCQRFTACQP